MDVVRRPELLTDVLQIVKATVAGTAAWWISLTLLGSSMPFLAPWTALLTVHATVHRSFSRGVQTTAASTIGVALSFVIGYYLGVHLWTFALALVVGLAASRLSWIREEGVAIATTAVFILSSGFDDQAPLLDERILQVGVGVATGIVVNLLVLPPLRDRQAGRYIDSINRRIGGVLISMAEDLADSWDIDRADAWFAESDSIRDELRSAWAVVRFARESRRMNPRRQGIGLPGIGSRGHPGAAADRASSEEILDRADEGVSHLRSLIRTLREAAGIEESWDPHFRDRWIEIVDQAGRAIADPDAEVEPLHEALEALSREVVQDRRLLTDLWPVYGSLLTSLRHIVVIVDDVTSARQAREAGS